MPARFLNSQTKSISSASLILAISYLLSAFLGLLRDRLLAGTFGAGSELDVYYTAFTVPDFIALILIFGAISAAVIPMFSAELIKSKEGAWQYFSTLFNVFLGFLIVICLIMIIFTPAIISLTAPGFSGHKKELAVLLMRIMFLSPIILGASNMISGILQVFHRFLATALAPLLYNLGIIIGIIFFVPRFGLQGLAWGVVLGGVMHLAIQLPPLFFSGFKYKPSFNYKNPGVIKTIKLMAPRSLGLGAGQLNTIATTAIASTLMAGSIAVFNLANNLSSILVNAVAVSVSTASFPAMSMAFLKDDRGNFLRKFSGIFRQIIFLIIPLSLLLLILRAQIVRVVLGAGKFSWADTKLTTACLGILALNLIAQALILFLSKTFYAAHNTKIPAIISGLTVAFNIILSLLLVWLVKFSPSFNIFLQDLLRLGGVANIGVIALSLAYTITAVLECFLLLYMFYKKFLIKTPVLAESEIVREVYDSLYKILIASLAMVVLTFIVRQLLGSVISLQTFWGIFFQLVVSGVVGVATYAFSAHLLKSPESKAIVDSFLRKFLYPTK
ncbi:MAG: murein biosynthesis integral membrane protein MurJ [Candidatus Staskawiczbacteria bacterium]|nr:murein biosynthesis integral membrane protein MurJ [Candidatus Staskawiczbacteria bacterium]